ncbi:MAG: hypothetical protein ABR555_10975 [Pyrinomonadaceae bacterium]
MNKRQCFLHVFLPLFLGGLVYVLWRDPKTLMFRWSDSLRMGGLISAIRLTGKLDANMPQWVRYSLPDGLWVYSLTAFMTLVWRDTDSWLRSAWVAVGLIVGCGIEFGQLIGVVPGSFDTGDLVACITGFVLALVFTSEINFKRSLNDASI